MECSFDTCLFRTISFEAVARALATVVLGGLVALGVNWYRRRQYRLQEEFLLDLAELRTEGVGYRNDGMVQPIDEGELERWTLIISDWHDALLTTAKPFSPVEAERLRTLDRVPDLLTEGFEVVRMAEVKRSNPTQFSRVNYYSEVLRRLDQMLEQRFRPTQAP